MGNRYASAVGYPLEVRSKFDVWKGNSLRWLWLGPWQSAVKAKCKHGQKFAATNAKPNKLCSAVLCNFPTLNGGKGCLLNIIGKCLWQIVGHFHIIASLYLVANWFYGCQFCSATSVYRMPSSFRSFVFTLSRLNVIRGSYAQLKTVCMNALISVGLKARGSKLDIQILLHACKNKTQLWHSSTINRVAKLCSANQSTFPFAF